MLILPRPDPRGSSHVSFVLSDDEVCIIRFWVRDDGFFAGRPAAANRALPRSPRAIEEVFNPAREDIRARRSAADSRAR